MCGQDYDSRRGGGEDGERALAPYADCVPGRFSSNEDLEFEIFVSGRIHHVVSNQNGGEIRNARLGRYVLNRSKPEGGPR